MTLWQTATLRPIANSDTNRTRDTSLNTNFDAPHYIPNQTAATPKTMVLTIFPTMAPLPVGSSYGLIGVGS